MMFKLVGLVALSLAASCVSVPNQQQIDSAEIGPKPSMSVAQKFARDLIKPQLLNPESAIFNFTDTIERGYYKPSHGSPSAPNKFGWVLGCNVVAKDSYGRFSGQQLWKVYFRDNAAVGTSLLVDYRGLSLVTEIDPPRLVTVDQSAKSK